MTTEPEAPNAATVIRARNVLDRGVDRMIELGVARTDAMYAAMSLAIELAKEVVGPGMTVEWLRNIADRQEQILLSAPEMKH